MEKVVLFTHGVDIDGFGCAILAKLAFDNVEVVYADNFNLDEKMKAFDREKGFCNYDKVYVTDHCPSFEYCKQIEQDKDLISKIRIFDHHVSRVSEQGTLPWIDLVVESQDGEKQSGTSLFYDHLVDEGLLKLSLAPSVFANLTRLYDTWQWVSDKTFGEASYRLNTLFQAVGREEYVKRMYNRIKAGEVGMSPEDEKVVDKYLKDFFAKVNCYINSMDIVVFENNKVGFVEIEDSYKNDIANKIREDGNVFDLDYVLMPVRDRNTVSLRNINPDFDVSKVAEKFGGGGHKGAASFPLVNLPECFKAKESE